MSRTELCARVAAETALSKTGSAAAFSAICSAIADALAKVETVTSTGLGTFATRHHPARRGRNPVTGETIDIATSNAASFKLGRSLGDAVSRGDVRLP